MPSTEVRTTTFYHEEWNFSLAYPADWPVIYQDEPAGSWTIPIAVAGPSAPGGRPTFMVNARRGEILQGSSGSPVYAIGPTGQMIKMPCTPEEYIALNRDSLAGDFPGYRFLAGEAITLADKPAARMEYSYDTQGGRITEEAVTLFGVGVTFQFIAEMPAAKVEKLRPLLRGILESFRLGRPEPQAEELVAAEPVASAEPPSSLELYNQAVELYEYGKFAEALAAFEACLRAGGYQPQAAYAMILCQQQLGRQMQLPQEPEGLEDTATPIYLATNLVCHLLQRGYAAALTKEGKTSEVWAEIGGARYRVSVISGFGVGGYFCNAWRKKQDGYVPLSDPSANPNPTPADRSLLALLKDLAALPPARLPAVGLPSALPEEAPPPAPAAQAPEPAPAVEPPAPAERIPAQAPAPVAAPAGGAASVAEFITSHGDAALEGALLSVKRARLSSERASLALDDLRLAYLFLPTGFTWRPLRTSTYNYQWVNLDKLPEADYGLLTAALGQRGQGLAKDCTFVLMDSRCRVLSLKWKQLVERGLPLLAQLWGGREARQERAARWLETNPSLAIQAKVGLYRSSASLNAAGIGGKGSRYIPWGALDTFEITQHQDSWGDSCQIIFETKRTGKRTTIALSVNPKWTEACLALIDFWRSREPDAEVPPPAEPPATAKQSPLAQTSLIAGILAWCLVPVLGALIAIVTGRRARREIDRSGGALQGKGKATLGLALGYAQVALILVVLVAGLISLAKSRNQAGLLATATPARVVVVGRGAATEVVKEYAATAPMAKAAATVAMHGAAATPRATHTARPTLWATATVAPPSASPSPAPSGTATLSLEQALLVGQALRATVEANPVWAASAIYDTFDANVRNWPTDTDANDYGSWTRELADGVYRWSMKTPKGVHSTIRLSAAAVTPLYFAADMRQIGGTDAGHGLVLHASEDSQYFFAITNSQSYSLARMVQGQWTLLANWTHCAAIRPWQTNRLAVAAGNGQFALLINDHFVGMFEDALISQGQVGFAIDLMPGKEAVFEFDNLELRSSAEP